MSGQSGWGLEDGPSHSGQAKRWRARRFSKAALTLERTATEGDRCPRGTPVVGTRNYHIAPAAAASIQTCPPRVDKPGKKASRACFKSLVTPTWQEHTEFVQAPQNSFHATSATASATLGVALEFQPLVNILRTLPVFPTQPCERRLYEPDHQRPSPRSDSGIA